MVKRYRDLQLIEFSGEAYIVIACDVSAGIGGLPGDLVQVAPEITGYYGTLVPLMEVLAVGASPKSVVNTLSVPLDTYGRSVLEGILKAMEEVGLSSMDLTGSTEDNVKVNVTALGVTVVAELPKQALIHYAPTQGQMVYVVGKPKVGKEVVVEELIGHCGEIANLSAIKSLRKESYIGHMLPVGSKGILDELGQLCKTHGCSFKLEDMVSVDLYKSAGPSTCLLVTAGPDRVNDIKDLTGLPVEMIARLH